MYRHRSITPHPMQIRMITTVAGPGVFLARNVLYDLPEPRANELIAARFATLESPDIPGPSTASAKRVKAVKKPHETR
jgi:hypothetical protein